VLPSIDPANRGQDHGFSLVEILVAIGVLTTVMVALLPQLIVGIRSTGTARLVTQAKGVAQGELEQMRAMPFYVAKSAGGVDVLDTYFPKRTETSPNPVCETGGRLNEPQTTWIGYVSPTATRCSYEPAGAFYRQVRTVTSDPNMGRFVIVTATQFLSADLPRTVVTPLPGYDTDATGNDGEPASTQIGVTVTVMRSDRGTWRPITTYTQIQDADITDTRTLAEAKVKAVDVSSVTADAGPMSFVAGQLDLLGTLSSAVSSSANLAATTAGLSSGIQASGAKTNVFAPPTASTADATGAPGALTADGCTYACWGGTYVGPVSATVEDSLPRAGTPTTPLQARITDVAANSGFTVGNSAPGAYVPTLELTDGLVKLDPTAAAVPSGISDCAPAAGGDQDSFVTASGYLLTNPANHPTAPYLVESCAVAHTTAVSILPTAFAPLGVIRVELKRASARCQVDGDGHAPSATHDFEAVVQYWNGTSYVTAATIVPGATTDPLLGVPLTTPVDLLGHELGDYIASWSSLTTDRVSTTATTGTASVDLPGVVTISTQPVRGSSAETADPTSGVSITIGAIRCSAEDVR
jgi:prepilin-type N-terminal cleavage/methylation domain-containing protein